MGESGSELEGQGARGAEPAEAGLRELALRLLAHSPWAPPSPREPELLVGSIPPGFALPLPEGTLVVGSLIHRTTTVVCDTDLPPGGALDFYRERLAAEGWAPIDFPPIHQGGFVHAFSPFNSRQVFCRGERGPSLTVTAFAGVDGRTDLRLELDAHEANPEASPCAQRRRMRHMGRDVWEVLPALVPPPNARQTPEGGNGGDERVSTSATLGTDLALGEVAAHYTGQLAAAGWARVAGGEAGPVAWSAWTFADKEGERWRGHFFAFQRPDAPQAYFLLLRAETEGARRGLGGGSASSAILTGMTHYGGSGN